MMSALLEASSIDHVAEQSVENDVTGWTWTVGESHRILASQIRQPKQEKS